MGNVFSSLSAYIGRWTSIPRLRTLYSIENTEEDVDLGKYENENDMQSEECSVGSDLQLDENGEDDVVLRSESEPSSAMQCTYNVQVHNGSNVMTGDKNTMIVRLPEHLPRKLRTAKTVYDVVTVVPGTMDEEAGRGPRDRTVVENITVYNPFIIAIGEGNVINLQLEGNSCQDKALSCERIVCRQLFPLQSEPLVMPSPGVDPYTKTVFAILCRIVDELYPLRDGGKWQEFQEALNGLHSKYDRHPGIQCFLLLEESVKLTYQKSFKAARRMAEEVLNIVNNDDQLSGALRYVLRALGNVALASIFRRLPRKKLGEASECLERAKESAMRLEGVNLTIPEFVLLHLDYERARFCEAFATVASEPSSCTKEARKRLGLCIDRCRALSDENQLYTEKQTFALVYLARLSLPLGHSEPGQCKSVKKQRARQAEKLLEEYLRSHSHLGDYPVAAQVKYLMTRSDLCLLKKNYTSAMDFGCQAHEIAVKYGFELETAPAQNHLEQIFRYCSSTTRQGKLQRVKDLLSCHSSSTTSDSDQKYNFTRSQRAT